jgi:CubicO group peptidase (beta-lactamase class C family)
MRGSFGFIAALALSACQTAPVAPLVAESLPASAIISAERSSAPGIVAAILRDGRIEHAYSWGGALCDGTGSADINAAYEIGSISKHITAVALLQLWERGRVDLDASVGTYLDDIPAAWRAVTLRQLLTHTSGVPDYEEAGGYGVYEIS